MTDTCIDIAKMKEDLARNRAFADCVALDFGEWAALQDADLTESATRIRLEAERRRDASPGDPLAKDVLDWLSSAQARTEGLVRQARDISRLGELSDSLGADPSLEDDPQFTEEFAALHDRVMPVLQGTRMERTLAACRAWLRPMRDALERHREALGLSPDDPSEEPETPEPARPDSARPEDLPKPPATEEPAENPLIAQRKKELGRRMDSSSIQAMSNAYFVRLWHAGADPGRAGDILFFVPAVARGINVHDLLGFSGGEKILIEAIVEIVTRFPAPEGLRK